MAYNDKTKLVTLTNIRELTPMSENVDDTKLINGLLYCQDVYIGNLLGTPLYTEVLEQVAAGTETTAIETLLDGNDKEFSGLRVCLAWYAYWKSLMDIQYSTTKKGLVKKFDNNSNPVDSSEFNTVRSDVQATADNYAAEITKFLKANIDDYPKYKEGVDDRTAGQPQSGSSGIAGI